MITMRKGVVIDRATGELLPQQISHRGCAEQEWDYLTADGELKKGKRNVFEFIQSSEPLTRYKERVNDLTDKGDLFYGDVSGIDGNDATDLNAFIAKSKSAFDTLSRMVAQSQGQGNKQDGVPNEQAKSVAKKPSGQTDDGVQQKEGDL